MARYDGVMLDIATLFPEDLDLSPLEALPVSWQYYDNTKAADICDRLAHAEIVLVNKVVLDRQVLTRLPKLKYIGLFATGMDNIDQVCANEQGIVVQNAKDYGTASIAQHAVSLMLSLATVQHRYVEAVKQGGWRDCAHFSFLPYPMMELSGRTLLIVGYGTVGQAVGRLAKALGMQVILANVPGSPQQSPDRVSVEEGLAKADVVSLHCPLNAHTKHLMNAERLALLQPHALLINTARGGLIDEAALAQALDHGKIGGAGLDVLATEPPAADNILLAKERPTLLVTPHIAWASVAARQKLIYKVADSLGHWLKDRPI